jgi:type I restriction enzyme S subunit
VDCVNRTAPVVDYETPYKMLRTTNVRGGFVDTRNVRYVTLETYERWTRRLLPERGDVFLTREAPLGDVGRLTSDDAVFLGQRLFHYRADPTVMDARFLAYALQSPAVQGWIKGVGMGATVEHARVGDFHRIPIPTPPLDVQEKIGGILSAYDDLIENNRRRIGLLEDAARMLYREWFIDFRFPGHERAGIIDGLPAGWKWRNFGDVCETIGGGTPPTDKLEYWNDGDIPWYTPTDITRNSCLALLDSATKITEAGLRGSSAKLLTAGTILMTSRASVGFFGIIETPSCTNQGFINIIPHDRRARMYILHNLMRRVEEIRSHAGGSTYKEISKGKFRALPVAMPDVSLLREFEEQAAVMHAEVRCLHAINQKLGQARDLLLPRLINGEIVV